tara:strand:- start:116 stop:319 length:204 start_codon:yes stop_codon:yes gene_type:complete
MTGNKKYEDMFNSLPKMLESFVRAMASGGSRNGGSGKGRGKSHGKGRGKSRGGMRIFKYFCFIKCKM